MDEGEYGKQCEDMFLEASLTNQKALRQNTGLILERCIDCGKKIPDSRRHTMETIGIDCIRCVICQEKIERALNGVD